MASRSWCSCPESRRRTSESSHAERSLVFEINSRGRSYRKEIPCDLQPSNVTIKSMVQNNSVVEITFARKGE